MIHPFCCVKLSKVDKFKVFHVRDVSVAFTIFQPTYRPQGTRCVTFFLFVPLISAS